MSHQVAAIRCSICGEIYPLMTTDTLGVCAECFRGLETALAAEQDRSPIVAEIRSLEAATLAYLETIREILERLDP